jgi:hypothetical protein
MTTAMKLEAKQRLQASDWKQDLNDIRSSKLKDFVLKLAPLVNIKHLGTDGHNDDGLAGVEIFFQPKSTSVYGASRMLDTKTVTEIAKIMAANQAGESELHSVNDEEEFLLLLLSDAE